MRLPRFVLALAGSLATACNPTTAAGPDDLGAAASDLAALPDLAEAPVPGPYCEGRDPVASRKPGKVGALSGKYQGVITGAQMGQDWAEGELETIKVVPAHLFRARAIRVNFGRGAGTARLHLTSTFGRSYPGIFPGGDPTELPDYMDPADLIPPVDVEVTAAQAGADKWMEVPIPVTYLLPTQHYMLAYEHLTPAPYLALEAVPAGEPSRSLIFLPDVDNQAYGIDGNYRMELLGDFVCPWADGERWFAPQAGLPFAQAGNLQLAVVDLDGDGNEDVVAGTEAWLGDGKGGYKKMDPPAFGGTLGQLVFGDLDNDGDQDAISGLYVGGDDDGDGRHVTSDSKVIDCNDKDVAIFPGHAEVAGNLKDDDCDGVADDGKDAKDHDGDGVSIALGDCNDAEPTVFSGAPELADGLDNDCNGKTDEAFTSRLLVNDGSGHFTSLPNPDVEVRYTTTSIAIGDGNGDGLPDFYVGNWLYHYPDFPTEQGQYYVNQGGALFVESLEKAGLKLSVARPPYGVTWADWNNDGKLDLYVSNYNLRDNSLWKNLGGTFTDVALAVNAAHDDVPSGMLQYPGGHSYGSQFADIDNDGDLDLFVPNISHPRVQPWSDPSELLINQGGPDFAFENKRRELGILYDEGQDHPVWLDYDNDGDLDLYLHAIYPTHYSWLYRNDGDHFTDVTYESGAVMHGGGEDLWLDANGDGALDLLVTQSNFDPPIRLFLNKVGQKNNHVVLELRGTHASRDAVGARVTLTAGGVSQIREVPGGTNRPAQSSRRVHFGLGQNARIDSLTVRWPGGASETITGATINSRFLIVEGSGKALSF